MKSGRDLPFDHRAKKGRENEESENSIEKEKASRDEAGDAEPRPPSSF